jgi:uncharacterized protein YrrD
VNKGEFEVSKQNDVLPLNSLAGKAVLSLATGNKLGIVLDPYLDPVNGSLIGVTVTTPEDKTAVLDYKDIHNFGSDALMAISDDSVKIVEGQPFKAWPNSNDLIGTKLITDSGTLLGKIADIFVTASPPPIVIYEIRESVFDKLLGRQIFIPASLGHALSDDRQRLVVPDGTTELASQSIGDLVAAEKGVYGHEPGSSQRNVDDTVVVPIGEIDDETVVRFRDDDETVVRGSGDDETVLRWRRKAK